MTTSAPTTFVDVLRRYRLAATLTQEELAKRAGLSVRGIQDLDRGVAIALGKLGNPTYDRGDAERVVAFYQESMVKYREIADRRGMAICLYSLGHLAVARGDGHQAGSQLAEALQIFGDLSDRCAIAEIFDLLALPLAQRGAVITAAPGSWCGSGATRAWQGSRADRPARWRRPPARRRGNPGNA